MDICGAPAGFAVFITIGGWIVMSLVDWLDRELFGLRQVTFWQALGLLVLCRILFRWLWSWWRWPAFPEVPS